jgi:hypothetical protein
MSLAIGLARVLGGFSQGMQQEDERRRILQERAQMRAAAELKDRLDRERQGRLDAQATEQTALTNRMRLAEQARQMTAAGFQPYQAGMMDGQTKATADALPAAAPVGMAGGLFGAAGEAVRARGMQQAHELAAAQGGFLKTQPSENERIREDERAARAEQARAAAAARAEQVRMQVDAANQRAQEANALRRDMARIAAAGRGANQPPQARTLPQGVESAISENATIIGAINSADTMLDKGMGKTAFGRTQGIKRSLGLERMGMTEEDQDLAAIVANVASQQIKLRSGAAVTASEWPRLRPFIPVLDGPGADDAATVRRKLGKMREIIAEETNARADYYERQGYAVPQIPGRRPSAPNVRTDRPAGMMDDPGFLDYLRSRGYAP